MTALGAELTARFATAFGLLADLRKLAPDEHAEIMRRLVDQVTAITFAEQQRKLTK